MIASIMQLMANLSFWPALADAALKSTILLALAAGLTLAQRKASAAVRHLTWSVALMGAVLLPMLAWLLPAWRVPVLSDWWPVNISHTVGVPAVYPVSVEKVPTIPPAMVVEGPAPVVQPAERQIAVSGVSESTVADSIIPAKAPQPQISAESFKLTDLFRRFAGPIWLIGFGVALLPLLAGSWQVARLTRRCAPLSGPEWPLLLKDAAASLNLRRGVRLLCGPGVALPMTWGAWRPVLLLPEAARTWPASRRRMVLLHELAHVRRWDWFTQILAYFACALFWYNPLAWHAARRMRLEREQACDDLVLRRDTRPSDYAGELLQLASGYNGRGLIDWATVPMARRSALEGRLLAILDERRNRAGLTRVMIGLALVLATAVTIPLAILHGQEAQTPMATVGTTTSSPANGILKFGLAPTPPDNPLSTTLQTQDTPLTVQALVNRSVQSANAHSNTFAPSERNVMTLNGTTGKPLGVQVMGWVKHEDTEVPIPEGKTLTVLEAITAAGGPRSDQYRVVVVTRRSLEGVASSHNPTDVRVINVAQEKMVAAAFDFPLAAGDMVVVGEVSASQSKDEVSNARSKVYVKEPDGAREVVLIPEGEPLTMQAVIDAADWSPLKMYTVYVVRDTPDGPKLVDQAWEFYGIALPGGRPGFRLEAGDFVEGIPQESVAKPTKLTSLDLTAWGPKPGVPTYAWGNQGRHSPTLKIGGQEFADGISMIANGALYLKLDGGTDKFTATIGMDGIAPAPAANAAVAAVFRVIGDGKVLYESKPMQRGDAPEKISVDTRGIKMLALEVKVQGEYQRGEMRDADWADATLEVEATGAQPQAVEMPVPALAPSGTPSTLGAVQAFIVQGDVQLIDDNGKTTPLTRQQTFTEGATVSTGQGASVLLVFSNGATLKLLANTQLKVTLLRQAPFDEQAEGTFLRLSRDPGRSNVILDVSSENIQGEVKQLNTEAGSTFIINTPQGPVNDENGLFKLPAAVPASPPLTDAQKAILQGNVATFVQQLATNMGIKLMPIPKGTFMMGIPADEINTMNRISGPQTHVTLTKDFFLGATDVTQGQYEALMGANPSYFKTVGKDAPVENVEWEEAVAFCKKLTEQERAAGRLPEGYAFALPTEAQWEYACRAGTTGPRPGFLDAMAWDLDNSEKTTHPVGLKQPNDWGLYDIIGNVDQWCADSPVTYPGGAVTDPVGPTPNYDNRTHTGYRHVVRGGSWQEPPGWSQSGSRKTIPGYKGSWIGFRVALVPIKS